MAKKQCSICIAPARRAVDRELRAGVPMVEISQHFDFSKSAIGRHAQHVGSNNDKAEQQLLAAAQRALALAEKRGNHRQIMMSLRMLTEVRRRSRIASPVEQESPNRNPQDLVARIRECYGLLPTPVETVPPPPSEDEQLVGLLARLVERVGIEGPVAAAATRLGRLLLRKPLGRAGGIRNISA